MITAIDTNILLDIFLPDPTFARQSLSLLKKAYDEGGLVICDIVYAELVPQFGERAELDGAIETVNVRVSSLDREISFLAGSRWALYRKAGGSRQRIITDFLIGAHATITANRFLTRDRGFYETYFPEAPILA